MRRIASWAICFWKNERTLPLQHDVAVGGFDANLPAARHVWVRGQGVVNAIEQRRWKVRRCSWRVARGHAMDVLAEFEWRWVVRRIPTRGNYSPASFKSSIDFLTRRPDGQKFSLCLSRGSRDAGVSVG